MAGLGQALRQQIAGGVVAGAARVADGQHGAGQRYGFGGACFMACPCCRPGSRPRTACGPRRPGAVRPRNACRRPASRFPEGRARLERVDDVFAATEGVAAVGAGGGHEHDLGVARQRADAVHDHGAGQVPARAGRGGDVFKLALAHAGIVFEEQRFGRRIGRVVAYVADEGDDAADARAGLLAQRGGQGRAVEIGFLDDDHIGAHALASGHGLEYRDFVAGADHDRGLGMGLVDGQLQARGRG